MAARVFVDANVLVYGRDASESPKQALAMEWMAYLWSEKAGRLSFQVLAEFYVTVTTKLQPGLDLKRARDDVRALFAWRPIQIDARVVEGAWLIQDRYKFSWWDALIVSAAQVGGCRYLLSEDFQEHQSIGDLTVMNPFQNPPRSLTV